MSGQLDWHLDWRWPQVLRPAESEGPCPGRLHGSSPLPEAQSLFSYWPSGPARYDSLMDGPGEKNLRHYYSWAELSRTPRALSACAQSRTLDARRPLNLNWAFHASHEGSYCGVWEHRTAGKNIKLRTLARLPSQHVPIDDRSAKSMR